MFADSNNLSQAGFAINSVTIPGAATTDIEGVTFRLTENDDDGLNELRESVVCEPGAVLELSQLRIVFGRFQDDLIAVQLEALCFRTDAAFERVEEDISVKGEFLARLDA